MELFLDQTRHYAEYLMPHHCVEEFFTKRNFLHVACLKALVSKCLGYGIVVGSSIVKVPQILKLLQSGSAEGLSLPSIFLELFAITTTLVYSVNYKFPFSAWGESLFLLIETAVIALLVLLYRGRKVGALLYTVLQTAWIAFFLYGTVPEKVFKLLQASQMVIVLLSKLIQIVENQSNKSTGQLSAITMGLLFAGSVARIFTSIQETGDPLVILMYVTSTLMNGIICGQILVYWNSDVKGRKPVKKNKKDKDL